jgi:hypothetical protein
MDGYIPSENEEVFDVKPIGVIYRCPFCRVGQMTPKESEMLIINVNEGGIAHYCNECGAQKILPKIYPHVEYIPIEPKEIDRED